MQDCLEDRGKDVRVLVGVDVGDGKAGALQLLNLGLCLAGKVFFADGFAQDGLSEIIEGGAEVLAVCADQGGNGVGIGDGQAVDKDQMAAHAKGGIGKGKGCSVIESRAAGHEAGGGEDAGLVQLGDGAVDAGGEAEVVCVEDELGRHGGQS